MVKNETYRLELAKKLLCRESFKHKPSLIPRLGPGSSSQYILAASYASTLDPTSAPSRLVRGARRRRPRRGPLEAPCRRHVFWTMFQKQFGGLTKIFFFQEQKQASVCWARVCGNTAHCSTQPRYRKGWLRTPKKCWKCGWNTESIRAGRAEVLTWPLLGYAPLNFTYFDVIFWHGVHHALTNGMPAPVLLFFCSREMTDTRIRKNTKAAITCLKNSIGTAAGFPFVCTCGSNTRFNIADRSSQN